MLADHNPTQVSCKSFSGSEGSILTNLNRQRDSDVPPPPNFTMGERNKDERKAGTDTASSIYMCVGVRAWYYDPKKLSSFRFY